MSDIIVDSKELKKCIRARCTDANVPLVNVCNRAKVDFKIFLKWLNSDSGFEHITQEQILKVCHLLAMEARVTIVMKDISLVEANMKEARKNGKFTKTRNREKLAAHSQRANT